VYLRLSRYEIEGIFEDPYPYDILRIVEMVRGSGVCLLACGRFLKSGESGSAPCGEGFNPGLASIPTVKPLDTEALSRLAMRYKLLVTVEEHTIIGGLAGAVSEFLAGFRGGGKASLYPLGLRDRYGESGNLKMLMAHGLDPDA
jgi:transketolase